MGLAFLLTIVRQGGLATVILVLRAALSAKENRVHSAYVVVLNTKRRYVNAIPLNPMYVMVVLKEQAAALKSACILL